MSKSKDSVKKPLMEPEISQENLDYEKDLELGEYLLHIYIIETQGLKLDDIIEGIFKISAFDQTIYSKVKHNVLPETKNFWGEHFFINQKFESREELENANFSIELYNHNTIMKDALIGQTSSSCLRVFTSEDHTEYDKWAILTNNQTEICSPAGYLKYSVNFVKAGSHRTNLEKEYDPSQDSKTLTNLSLPPEIQIKQKQITCYVYKGDRIVKLDTFGKGADPYVKLDLGGLKLKSSIKEGIENITYFEKLMIPTISPTIVNSLKISFKDNDTGGSNDYIGCKSFKLSDIERGEYAYPTWQYFYGAHESASNDSDLKKQMNKIPEISSCFKGALLMAIEMTDAESPAYKIQPMTPEDTEILSNFLKPVTFTASFFIEYVQNLKSKPENHCLNINWGGKFTQSKSTNYQQGVLTFFQEVNIRDTFEIPIHLLEEFESMEDLESLQKIIQLLPQIIISTYHDKKNLSFYKIKPQDFVIGRDDEGVSCEVKLHADGSVSDLQENQAGLLRFKLSVGMDQQYAKHQPYWMGNRAMTKIKFKPIRIICNLFQAKNLLPSDDDGAADPLVLIYHLGTQIQSRVFPKTLNPIWNQRLIMNSYMIGDSIPSAIISLWDKDENWSGSKSFDFLGYAIKKLSIQEIIKDDFNNLGTPHWIELCLGKGNFCGKLMINFKIVTQDSIPSFHDFIKMSPQFWRIPIHRTRHHVKINILGLRELESTGMLPIKTAGIKIATSSLRQAENLGNGAVFTNLQAIAKTSGSNPTIGSVLVVSCDIPAEIKIMPVISCSVFESGFRLFSSDSTIGTFSINVGMFALITKQNIIKKLKNLKKKCSEMNKLEVCDEIDNLVLEIESSLDLKKKNIDQISEFNEVELEPAKKEKLLDPALFGGDDEDDDEEEMVNAAQGMDLMAQMQQMGNEKQISDSKSKHSNIQSGLENDLLLELASMRTKNLSKQRQTLLRAKTMQYNNNDDDDEEEELVKQNFNMFNFQKKMGEKILASSKFTLPKEMITVYEGNDHRIEDDPSLTDGFMSLGYATEENMEKHFRKIHEGELEESEYMGDEIFFTLDVSRGKKYNLKKESLFSRVFGSKEEKHRIVGKFRGNVEVIEEDLLQKIHNLSIENELLEDFEIPYNADNFKNNSLDKEILKSVTVTIRLYIIDAIFNVSKDLNSENDSYIKVEFNGKKYTDSNKIMNRNNPKFFSMFEFEHVFPGPSDLKIQFYDYDALKSDEFIGETIIDTERRFFDKRWRSFNEHPIESRLISHPSSIVSVGQTRLFVDIFDKNTFVPPLRNIRPRPSKNVELRIIIWEVWDVSSQDFEDVSDLFVKVLLPSYGMSMKTDTHFRAQGGFGSFNWRTKFTLEINEYFNPSEAEVQFLIYDKDLLKKNDFVSSISINLAQLIEDTLYYNQKQKFTMESDQDGNSEDNKIVLETKVKNVLDEGGSDLVPKIKFSIDCLPEKDAKISPVGIGRGDPNQDPHLEAPKGRFKFTLNPFELLNQLVGPQFKKKACIIICSILCVLMIILILPIFFSELIATCIEKLFGIA